MDAPGFVGVDLPRRNSCFALDGERRAERGRALAGGRDEHQPAAVQPAIGLRILEVVRKIAVDLERGLRERDIGGHGVMRAHDARRLRRRAAAQLAALEQQHASGAEAREMAGDRRADHAAADDDRVVTFHGPLSFPRQPGGAVSLSCQRESAACESQTVAANSAMPAAAISSSAANSRGMLSCIPASRIW